MYLKKENETIEVFYVEPTMAREFTLFSLRTESCDLVTDAPRCVGWWWQPSFPGRPPEGEPIGPFSSEEQAVEHAQL